MIFKIKEFMLFTVPSSSLNDYHFHKYYHSSPYNASFRIKAPRPGVLKTFLLKVHLMPVKSPPPPVVAVDPS